MSSNFIYEGNFKNDAPEGEFFLFFFFYKIKFQSYLEQIYNRRNEIKN